MSDKADKKLQTINGCLLEPAEDDQKHVFTGFFMDGPENIQMINALNGVRKAQGLIEFEGNQRS